MVQGGGELGLGLPTGLFYLFCMGPAGAFGCFGFCMFQMCSCCRDNREHDRDKYQREEDEEMGRVVPRSERWGGKPLPCQWLRDQGPPLPAPTPLTLRQVKCHSKFCQSKYCKIPNCEEYWEQKITIVNLAIDHPPPKLAAEKKEAEDKEQATARQVLVYHTDDLLRVLKSQGHALLLKRSPLPTPRIPLSSLYAL
jgi:hypothetical protein